MLNWDDPLAKPVPAKAVRKVAEQAADYSHLLGPSTTLGRDLMPRIACQFRWHNRGFADFEDHLSAFSADKRKKIRRERRRIDESGLRIEVWTGQDMTSARWDARRGACVGSTWAGMTAWSTWSSAGGRTTRSPTPTARRVCAGSSPLSCSASITKLQKNYSK